MKFFKGLLVVCLIYISLFLVYLLNPGLDFTMPEKSLLGVCTAIPRSTGDTTVTALRL